MTKPTPEQAKELKALANRAEVIEYLNACLDDAKQRLVTQQEPEAFRVIQGHAQAYQKLLNEIAGPLPPSGKR